MIYDVQSRVVSRIKNTFPIELKTKYPDITFTTNDRVLDEPKFPTVYVHQLASSETGGELTGTEVCGIVSAIQIEVYDNKSMSNADEVMQFALETMKSMRFRILTMPEFQNNPNVYRKIARFSRVIGDGDTL